MEVALLDACKLRGPTLSVWPCLRRGFVFAALMPPAAVYKDANAVAKKGDINLEALREAAM